MGYGDMMGWGGSWGGGHMYGVGWVGLVLVILIVVWVARSRRGSNSKAGPVGEDRALAILRERYARGEIEKAEFDIRRQDLS